MIGIFDSGVGGLTVLKAIREHMPHVDVVYFGDTQNAPYGLKSPAELSQLTARSILLLKERGADHIVSACNSVSASLVSSLFDVLSFSPFRVIEMVGPTVAQFRDTQARIGLCATPATINAGIYQNAFALLGKQVMCIPIPDLAGAIEEGRESAELELMVKNACGRHSASIDTLILACTHYPLVHDIFNRVMGPRVVICDPALGVAERVTNIFAKEAAGTGATMFLLSKESLRFRALVEGMFPRTSCSIEII